MLKMVIALNDKKILEEEKYHLDGIYRAIESMFRITGLPKITDETGALVYKDCGRGKDYSLFGKVANTLKRQTWFMENVSEWRFYDSDDSDNQEGFVEEDLLLQYRDKK